MATVSCGEKKLKFFSGCTVEVVLEAVRGSFGECVAERPRLLRCEDGTFWYALDKRKVLPDGDYAYEQSIVEKRLDPPSSQGYNVVQEKQTAEVPEVLNFMPVAAIPPLPLQLLEPGFGTFVEYVRGGTAPKPRAADFRHFCALASACSSFYNDESEFREKLRKIWKGYLGLLVQDEMYTGACNKRGSTATDLGIREPRHDALVLLEEVKRGISVSRTEPDMRGIANYSLNWSSARVAEKELFSDTCYPALLLQHVGKLLIVGALVTLPDGIDGKIWYQPLSSVEMVPIQGHDMSLAMQGVITCMAVKATVTGLMEFYESVGKQNTVSGPSPRVRELFRRRIPITLHSELGTTVKQVGEKLVYVLEKPGEAPCLVKYSQRYGASVHTAWAKAGLAPTLFGVEELNGGWIEVRMEWLADVDGWKRLYDLPEAEADALRDEVILKLKAAHEVQVGTVDGVPTYGVHGDVRDGNVMVNAKNGLQVRFVDFDWAQEEGLEGSCYPAFMNQTDINWPAGVEDGLPMLRTHDLQLLALPQAQQSKRAIPPTPVEVKPHKPFKRAKFTHSIKPL